MPDTDRLIPSGATGRAAESRLQRAAGPLLLAGGVAVVSVALHFRDPHEQGSWGLCPFFELTGLYCPGCGGLRAVNDLTRGDVWGAASSNVLFVATIPLLVFLWAGWLRGRWRGDPAREVRRPLLLGGVVLGVAVAFAVLRNLPGMEWLAP